MLTAVALEVAQAVAPAFALRGIFITVGPDGVRCHVRGRVILYRWDHIGYASLRQRPNRGESLAVCGPSGRALVELPILHEASRREAASFVRGFQAWLPSPSERMRADVRHPWRRRGRPLEEWIRALDRDVRGGGSGYRTALPDRSALMHMLRDPGLPEDLRAAAGWVIGRTAQDGMAAMPQHQPLPALAWRMIRLATAPEAFVPARRTGGCGRDARSAGRPRSRSPHAVAHAIPAGRAGVSWMAIRLDTMSAAIAHKSLETSN